MSFGRHSRSEGEHGVKPLGDFVNSSHRPFAFALTADAISAQIPQPTDAPKISRLKPDERNKIRRKLDELDADQWNDADDPLTPEEMALIDKRLASAVYFAGDDGFLMLDLATAEYRRFTMKDLIPAGFAEGFNRLQDTRAPDNIVLDPETVMPI